MAIAAGQIATKRRDEDYISQLAAGCLARAPAIGETEIREIEFSLKGMAAFVEKRLVLVGQGIKGIAIQKVFGSLEESPGVISEKERAAAEVAKAKRPDVHLSTRFSNSSRRGNVSV
ncbi:hypothetical protein GCM10028812_40220 [Ancylobacter sonchi]